VENQFNCKIKSFYSDNGGEFIKLKSYFQNNGIQHLTTPPHTPQHNGLCERKHRHLLETTRCLLHQASLPPMFWSFAAQTAAYLINRLPTPTLKMRSPFFTLFQTKPNYNKLRSFGCLCFPWLKPYTSHKLEPRSEPCVFLGYSLSQSAYICYNCKTNKFYNSRHVQFIENIFPYSKTSSQEHTSFPHLNSNDTNPNYSSPLTITHPIDTIPTLTPNLTHQTTCPPQETIQNNPKPLPRTQPTPPLSPPTHLDNHEHINPPNNNEHIISQVSHHSPTNQSSTNTSTTLVVPPSNITKPLSKPKVPVTNHPMQTRAKHGIFKPKQLNLVTKYPLPNPIEPTCVSQALKSTEWQQAMTDEFMALMRNGTWTLVPPSPHYNVIGNK